MSTITHAPGIEVDYSHIENAVERLKQQYASSVRDRREKWRKHRASPDYWDLQEWMRFRRESWAYRDALRLLCPRRARK